MKFLSFHIQNWLIEVQQLMLFGLMKGNTTFIF